MSEERQRTQLQNKSLHLWCAQLGQALNDGGFDMKVVLKPECDIPWSPRRVKENLWRSVQMAMTGKESTTELTTVECTEIAEVINRHLAEKFGVSCPWPSEYERSLDRKVSS